MPDGEARVIVACESAAFACFASVWGTGPHMPPLDEKEKSQRTFSSLSHSERGAEREYDPVRDRVDSCAAEQMVRRLVDTLVRVDLSETAW